MLGGAVAGPIARVLTALELLQSRRQMGGGELAEQLGVDRRTVRRYIALLEEMGVPITTEQGRHGGYRLIPGFKLPPMMFSDEEALAIALGLLAARQLGLGEATPAITAVQAKLERVMPDGLRRRAQAIGESIQVLLPRPTPIADHRLLLTLTQAVQAQRAVALSYTAANTDSSARDVDPYGLLFQNGRWYLGGFCHLRKALRTFRIDRICAVTLLDQAFQRPKDYDVARQLMEGFNSEAHTQAVEVVLHTDAETAAQAFYCEAGTAVLHPHPQGLLLRTRVDSMEWFAWWLAQLHFGFIVLAPDALRAAVRARAQTLLASCDDGPATPSQ